MDFSLAPVTIQQILVFLQVVESNGFAKASSNLHMTQSAVSKSIAKLERELGISLFTRTTRELHLTDPGKILYDEWKIHIQAIYASYNKAADIQKNKDATVHIGILNTARPDRYFWEIEEKFKTKYPNITLDLESEYMTDLVGKLAANLYDAIMIPDFERFSLADNDLVWKWAARSNACLIIPEDNPLAQRKNVKMKEIIDQTFISLEARQSSGYLADLTERFAPYSVFPKIQFHFKNAYDIKYLFRPDNCILFSDDYFDYQKDLGFVKIPVTDQYNGIICGYSPNNQNPYLQSFLEILPDYEQ